MLQICLTKFHDLNFLLYNLTNSIISYLPITLTSDDVMIHKRDFDQSMTFRQCLKQFLHHMIISVRSPVVSSICYVFSLSSFCTFLFISDEGNINVLAPPYRISINLAA